MPEGNRPLQAVRLHRACRQQRDRAVESIERLLWLVSHYQQSDAVFIASHDPGQAFRGRAMFGFIELCLAGGDGFCILRLQQLRAILSLNRPNAQQKSDPNE